ncbi:metallophosphoesterase [Halococcus thailandensis]|uniref:Metallophosphoesterase n=1 Tax=Halococcus thailandensis JCM 13552 TaxID=1227457 RepID=M0N4B5_9EURY|nr:metallophosphoesterase [Halococcus thailandensis]EMA51949.1 metallophosphoesterase [Halococcus thailandensis JCM 13552]
MADTCYLISDLHIGGDEQLTQVDFLDELLGFLRELEASDEDAELIINGDAFGLWEFTEIEGPAKFDALLDRYPELFEQLRATGEEVPITLIPGNHDYELAAHDEYVDRLAAYNVTLEQEIAITREIGDHTIHIEHGMQEDPSNRIPDFGNPYANPPGYFVNRHITSRAGRLSGRGKYNWLKDIQAVTPMTRIPDWLLSNYFYREMSGWLRYASVPFFLLFNLSVLYLGVYALDAVGVWSRPMSIVESVLDVFGPVGTLIDVVLVANVVFIVLLLLISIPLYVLARDVRKTLRRFGLAQGDDDDRDPTAKYNDRAREVFAETPDTAVFLYGHTHRASVTEIEDRLVINTGTWLKRLRRVEPVLGILPPVFYASYRLNYVRLTGADDGSVVVDCDVVDKPDPGEETLLQRLLTPAPNPREEFPVHRRVDPSDGTDTESSARSANGRREQ